MELVIPDGAQVHITIGQPQLLALPHETHAVIGPYQRRRGRIGKALLAGVLLITAFQAGRFLPHRAEVASAAPPAASLSGTGAAGGGAGDMPPAFRAQIAQPPQVVPAPGAAPAGAAGGSPGNAAAPAAVPAPANAFGLQG